MKERIVKDTLVYSVATFWARMFDFARSIIVARFLGPSLYGLWNASSIILEYSRYSHLGVLNAMNREIPFYRGKKDNGKVEEIRNAGFSMATIPPLLIGLVLVLVSMFLRHKIGHEWVKALIAIAVLVFLRQLYDFFILLFRSNNEFKFLSKLQFVFSLMDLGLISILVVRFGFDGFLSAMVLNYIVIITFIFFRSHHKFRLKPCLDKTLLVSLAKIGILITLIDVVINMRTVVDRLMVARFLGITQLGYFSISYVLIRFIYLIPSALSQIMYPRLVEKYGVSNRDTNALKNYIEVTTYVLAYSMPLLIGEMFLFLPFGISKILPQYIPGIVAAQVTILGLFFFSVGIMAENFMVTTNRLYLHLWYSAFAVVINLVLDYVFLKAGFDIKGVAIGGILLTSAIYTSSLLGFVMFHYLKNGWKTVLYLMKLYFPFFYSLSILLMLNYSHLCMFNRMVIFAVFCLPLFWKLEKDTKAVSFVWAVLRNSIKR